MQQHRDLLKQLGRQDKKRRTTAQSPANGTNREETFDFAAAVGAVRPLPPQNRIARNRDTAPIRVRAQENFTDDTGKDFYIGHSEYGGEPPASFTKNGRGRVDLDKLRTSYRPSASLDLHGCRAEEAQILLNRFIGETRTRGGICVEIVHGSGLGSKDFVPVLKTLVRRWLMAHPDVLAYTEPHRHNDGAVLVLLKKLRK